MKRLKDIELSQLDTRLIQGLIAGNEACKQEFHERFKEKVYVAIESIYKELSISPPSTDDKKNELFLALCDHLHQDNGSQLKEYLSQKQKPSLENWLVNVKLPDFLPDKIVVDGLLHNDREITQMFVSSSNKHSLKGMINIDYLSTVIKDYDHGGKQMNPQTLICEIFSLIMLGEDTKKDKGKDEVGRSLQNFKFDCSLKTYITKLLKSLPRYTRYIRGKTGQEDELKEKHDKIQALSITVDPEKLKVFIQKVFNIMSFTEKGRKDAELLNEYYLKGKKQKDMAILHGIRVNLMNQKVNRAREKFRDVCTQHFGTTKYYQIEEYYGEN